MSRIDFANKLKAALESGAQTAAAVVDPVVVEPTAAATEDFKGKMGAAFGGVIWTAAQKNSIEKKGKILEELKQKIAELKKTVHSAEALMASFEGFDLNETYSEEGYAKHFGDEYKTAFKDNFTNGFWNFLLGHKTIKNLIERGGKYGDIVKELDSEIRAAKEEIARLEGKHSGALEYLVDDLPVELQGTVESFFSLETPADDAAPAQEAIGAGKGALIGGTTGAFGTAYLGHKIDAKAKELKEVEQDIRELEAELRGMHHAKESLDSALEGAGSGFVKGVGAGIAGTLIAGPLGGVAAQATLGGAMGSKLKEIEDKLEAAKAKRAELKRELHGMAVSSREDISEAYGTVLEGIGHTAAGVFGGVIATGIMGHKIASKKEEIEELKKKITEKKAQIAEISHHSTEAVSSTEAVGSTTGAGIGHGLIAGVVGGAVGTGYVGHKQGQQLDELNKKLAEYKEELAHLEQEYQSKLHASKEELTNDLMSSLESDAVIAAPAGGTETIVADEAPHRCEDHLMAADGCGDVMSSHLDEANRLHRAVAQLESLMQVVHNEPNGLSQTDAKYVTLAVEHITADFAADVKLVPSIEAFGGPVSSQEATLTLEANVKEVATQIWAYLKALWTKFMDALKNMWDHLFGAAQALSRSAKGLEARANAITGAAREPSIDIGPLAHRVAVEGKLPSSLKGILTFMKLGDLKTIAEKALDESEITAAVQKMVAGGNAADSATDASLREAFKTMPLLNRELPGGVRYTISDAGEVHREVSDAKIANTVIPVLSRVDLIHLGHEAVTLANDAAAVLKDISAATAKDSGHFLDAITIEDEARAREVSHAVSVMVSERKRGLKLVADAITDYLKAAQALVAIGDKCVGKYGDAGHVEKAVDATKAAVSGAVDSAKAAGAAVAAKVAGGGEAPEAAAAPAA